MSLGGLFRWGKRLLADDMARLTGITRSLIDLIDEHGEKQFPHRKRLHDRNFPLWVAMCGVRGAQSKIKKVVDAGASYPFLNKSVPKDLISERMLKGRSITSLQFNCLDEYISLHGFYNNHHLSRSPIPPVSVIPIGFTDSNRNKSVVGVDIDEWFSGVIKKTKKPISLRAILDERVTDLIMIKALDIEAFWAVENQKKRHRTSPPSLDQQRSRLYPRKDWMRCGA